MNWNSALVRLCGVPLEDYRKRSRLTKLGRLPAKHQLKFTFTLLAACFTFKAIKKPWNRKTRPGEWFAKSYFVPHRAQNERGEGLDGAPPKVERHEGGPVSLAAIHYLRSHFQEATDIYKRLLLENRDDLALNVYVAMCYYKLDYYDVSLEILAVYLQAHPDSAIAINLKACNHFRLYNGKAAESEL